MPPPLKLAVIGGGPSAFYVASRILSLLPASKDPALRVHVYDRLWAPHGLVRYGVAPDHPEVKNCTHKFDETAKDPRFRFFGNVNISNSPPLTSQSFDPMHLPLSSVFENYTHLLFSSGCTLPKLHPALPPSSACVSALSLVHWYTLHPLAPLPPALDKIEHVSLIGNGNVSLDVARLLLSPIDHLQKYDVPEKVLEVLASSKVRHVSIFGRRGPLEAAFTMKELREMINLPDSSMHPLSPEILNPTSKESLTRQQSRVLSLLSKGSKNPAGSTRKTWSLDFFRSPIGYVPPSPSDPTSQTQLTLEHTFVDPKTSRAIPTSPPQYTVVPTDLIVTSLGFQADPTSPSPPVYDPGLGHLRVLGPGGRVVGKNNKVWGNTYASGWAAVGARGVLATTMMDAYAVADTVLSDYMGASEAEGGYVTTTPISPPYAGEEHVADPDIAELVLNPSPHPEDPPLEVTQGIKDGRVVQYEDWKKVDEEEQRRGREKGKERERMDWEGAKVVLGR
ncbi:hypothetical protein BDQ17DRAFT_1409390 [Cyathus striatus]|nr:hypothetical protein BDQ17DRAFT_1409390 [Cyathus striatus]